MPGGPLAGIRVVELAGLGAVPFAGMLLADAGADVLRIERLQPESSSGDLVERGRAGNAIGRDRRSIGVDLKRSGAREFVLDVVERADAVVEGFRPGVVERLGIGPSECLARNRRLVYGRLSGWGRSGPLADRAGHDINYLALSGTLSALGPADRPPSAPLNLLADFGGGGAMLAFGVASALVAVAAGGAGGVVDGAMVDGAALLATYVHSMRAAGTWLDQRQSNVLDGGAPFYATYATADGRFVAVGAVEPQFYREFLDGLGLDGEDLPAQLDRDRWPELRVTFADRIATRTRAEWEHVFTGTDACVTPVLTMDEAPRHPQLAERNTFITVGGVVQPRTAVRFDPYGNRDPSDPAAARSLGRRALEEWGVSAETVERLSADRVVDTSAG